MSDSGCCVENRLQSGEGGSSLALKEAFSVIQVTNDRNLMAAVDVVRNGYYHRYILKVEPVRFAEGLDTGMRERRESRVTLRCLA